MTATRSISQIEYLPPIHLHQSKTPFHLLSIFKVSMEQQRKKERIWKLDIPFEKYMPFLTNNSDNVGVYHCLWWHSIKKIQCTTHSAYTENLCYVICSIPVFNFLKKFWPDGIRKHSCLGFILCLINYWLWWLWQSIRWEMGRMESRYLSLL